MRLVGGRNYAEDFQKTVLILGILLCLLISGFYAGIFVPPGGDSPEDVGELSLLRIAIRIFPVSSVTITNPSEMTWNPLLSLKKGEKMFLNKICSDYPCSQGKEYSAIQEIATA